MLWPEGNLWEATGELTCTSFGESPTPVNNTRPVCRRTRLYSEMSREKRGSIGSFQKISYKYWLKENDVEKYEGGVPQ